ncbi:MAG: hypothetical protein DMG49_27395 [Acidobacteria bacterium]|nr:MAG: hypothetical protein DMG49_27395 [Acidobacteriota bacterium]
MDCPYKEDCSDRASHRTQGSPVISVDRLDRRKYPTGRKVSKEEMKGINLQPDRFHGEWNYVIRPHQPRGRQRMEIG